METRTKLERLDDLEHDNNSLRLMLADIQLENTRLANDFDAVKRKCDKLIATVNEFVNRFSVV